MELESMEDLKTRYADRCRSDIRSHVIGGTRYRSLMRASDVEFRWGIASGELAYCRRRFEAGPAFVTLVTALPWRGGTHSVIRYNLEDVIEYEALHPITTAPRHAQSGDHEGDIDGDADSVSWDVATDRIERNCTEDSDNAGGVKETASADCVMDIAGGWDSRWLEFSRLRYLYGRNCLYTLSWVLRRWRVSATTYARYDPVPIFKKVNNRYYCKLGDIIEHERNSRFVLKNWSYPMRWRPRRMVEGVRALKA